MAFHWHRAPARVKVSWPGSLRSSEQETRAEQWQVGKQQELYSRLADRRLAPRSRHSLAQTEPWHGGGEHAGEGWRVRAREGEPSALLQTPLQRVNGGTSLRAVTALMRRPQPLLVNACFVVLMEATADGPCSLSGRSLCVASVPDYHAPYCVLD